MHVQNHRSVCVCESVCVCVCECACESVRVCVPRVRVRVWQNLILPSATCSWINIFVDPGTTLLLTNQI